ncbi:MAG TPA: YfhO family protein [bacterium]|nr:YfhO family protein [bacterium]HNF87034.1 YfhO family protein [bacterium]
MAKLQSKERQKKSETSTATGLQIKPWQQTAISILILYALNVFLFSDIVIKGKAFSSGADNSAATAISRGMGELVKQEGDLPLWNPFMFAGMPSFASGMYGNPDATPLIKYQKYFNPSYYVSLVVNLFFGNRDNVWEVATFFLAGVFMFLLARSLGFGHLIALTAAVSYMFCNFFVASMAAGHGGKVRTIAYIPLVVWSVFNFFQNRSVWTWAIMGLVLGLFFQEAAHTQIIYYAFLMLGIYCVVYLVDEFRNNLSGVIRNGLGFTAALITGLGFGALGQIALYVYSDVTMRSMGPAFAETTEMAGAGGMTFDYITMWSFHPLESVTFFIPGFFGLESPYYWGWMTFTSSAFYIGLLPMVAAVFGILYRRNTITKTMVFTALLALLIAFGKFFEPFFKLMLSILPFFEKFRVPSMILTLFIFAVTVLSCYGLDYIFNPTEEERKRRGGLEKVLLYVMGGIAVLGVVSLLMPDFWSGMAGFLADGDAQRYNANQIAQLKKLRLDALNSGVIRFAVLGVIIFGALYLYMKEKIGAGLALMIMLMVNITDTISLNMKTLRPVSRAATQQEFQETETIRFLHSDTTRFRIFSLLEHAQSGSPVWNYFGIESLSGYSPAKMRIYQDVIEFSMYKGPDPQFPINMNVVNMLNAKYVLANGRLPEGMGFLMRKIDEAGKTLIYENKNVLPRAYFVSSVETIGERQQALLRLNSVDFDVHRSAFTDKAIKTPITPFDSAKAEITQWMTDKISISAFVDKPGFMVLSETYYPHGWKAYVDGQETEIYKTNYILRGIQVPAGQHTIEFRFEPAEYTAGIWASTISFFGVIGLLVVGGVMQYRRLQNEPKS